MDKDLSTQVVASKDISRYKSDLFLVYKLMFISLLLILQVCYVGLSLILKCAFVIDKEELFVTLFLVCPWFFSIYTGALFDVLYRFDCTR